MDARVVVRALVMMVIAVAATGSGASEVNASDAGSPCGKSKVLHAPVSGFLPIQYDVLFARPLQRADRRMHLRRRLDG